MSKKVITINEDESMNTATKLMKEKNIKLLPVMRNEKLIGIVTDRDLKRASASDATTLDVHELLYLLSKIHIKDIMTKNPITVPDNYTIEETAEILLTNKISGVPVVNTLGAIIGIITQSDIFRALISLTGVSKRGIQFSFEVEDRPGSIKDLTDVIRKFGGRMISILSSYDGMPAGTRKVFIRMYSITRTDLKSLEDKLKGKAKLLYMVDHRENTRTIYS
jgi:acetoin utilization protein AcuB